MSHIIFDAASIGSNPNANPLCGLTIRATRFDEQVNAQRSVDLTVVDRCTDLILLFCLYILTKSKALHVLQKILT